MASNTSEFLAATVKNSDLAIPLQVVQEVVMMPTVTPLPSVPPHVRGVINLRGAVIPLLDLRVVLGLQPLAEEFNELDAILVARLEDHKK